MSPYWTDEQIQTLTEMLGEGRPVEEIAEKLHRSIDAVVLKAKRLGIEIPEKCRAKNRKIKVTKSGATTTTPLPEIKAAEELLTMEEMLKVLMGALKLLQQPGISSLELKRCRAVVSMARSYLSMLKTYERMADLEQWLVNTQAKILSLTETQLKHTEDPTEKARLEKQITEMKKFLEESAAKHGYKPFEKKPSLIAPS
ncbi:MAG: GcrA family cell cycle regulator [Candidatus Bathyarchaeota archaeon]|nr:GcrA family cell cycle regulator [Candidatus Bathyarchaeota archaeon]